MQAVRNEWMPCWGGNYTRTPRNVSALEYLEACHLEPNNVASVDEITEGPAETGVGVYSERALRCKTNTLCEYVCGEKLMSTRVNAHHLT